MQRICPHADSDEERRDLLSAYVRHNGSMDGILSEVPCSTVDDEARFRAILTEAIKNKEVRSFRVFTVVDTAAQERRRREAAREAREAEELKRELGLEGKLGKDAADEDGEEALKTLILQNQRKRGEAMDAVIENILKKEKGRTKEKAKTKGKKKEKNATVEEEEPTEEEFQALQARLFPGKSNGDDNDEEGEKEELESSKPIRTKRSAQAKVKKVEAKATVKRGRSKKDAGEPEAEDIPVGATKQKAAREQEGEDEKGEAAELPAKRSRKKAKTESEKVEKAPARRSTRVK